jgi:hypothetical protein
LIQNAVLLLVNIAGVLPLAAARGILTQVALAHLPRTRKQVQALPLSHGST